jgi:DNA-binding NtrC family response regulator
MTSPQNADTILILDDEFDIMNIFTLALEQQGYHVIGFTEPLLALDHFQKNSDRYGLVISDLRMPVMNGYQFVKKVKEIKPQVKVFFISAFEINEIEFRTELPFVKVDEFIKKPILLEDFISTVSKHINN